MLTLEEEVAVFAFCLRANRVHHSIIKQRLYQRRGAHTSCLWASGHLARVDLLEGFSVPAGFGDELTQASRSRQHDLGHSGAISTGRKITYYDITYFKAVGYT